MLGKKTQDHDRLYSDNDPVQMQIFAHLKFIMGFHKFRDNITAATDIFDAVYDFQPFEKPIQYLSYSYILLII